MMTTQNKEEKYAALLHHEFGFWWTGFYRVSETEELVLSPEMFKLAAKYKKK